MIEDADKVLAIFGLKLINAVAAAFVSFASLRFWKGLDTGDKWMSGLVRVRTSSAGLIAARADLATVDSYRVSTQGFIMARRT